MNSENFEPLLQSLWRNKPPVMNWDPVAAIRLESQKGGQKKLVPLATLLKLVRQGVVVTGLNGEITVETARVADIQPALLSAGNRSIVSSSVLRRHMIEAGDVLVARISRPGQAAYISVNQTPLVPREDLLVARPQRREWGPAICAALCTQAVKRWLGQFFTGGRVVTLTKDQLGEIPIPSPTQYDFSQISALVDQAGALVHEGQESLERVRGEVGLYLQEAPVDFLSENHLWLQNIDVLQGWCWQDVQRHWLHDRAQWQVRKLTRLSEVADLWSHRAKTVTESQQAFVLGNDGLRPSWHLALPELRQHPEPEPSPEQTPSTTRRFFAVDREALLLPTVSNIVAEPVVVPEEVIEGAEAPLLVPLHWLPLIGLPHPRALAVVLDHPFVRLQRRLSVAFSSVAHITREAIANLFIPAVPEERWHAWESELHQAHNLFIEATAKAKQAIAIVEEWYA
jgi:hypothetical protein